MISSALKQKVDASLNTLAESHDYKLHIQMTPIYTFLSIVLELQDFETEITRSVRTFEIWPCICIMPYTMWLRFVLSLCFFEFPVD